MAPPTGLEPVTSWLTVMRSTDWAMEEYLSVPFQILNSNGDSCGNRPSASLLMARITDAHRFELKTVHWTVFLTLKPSRVRFRKQNQYQNVINRQRVSSILVTRAGIEPALPAWEAGVLTAWPTSHFSRDSLLWAPCFWCTIRGSNPGHPD